MLGSYRSSHSRYICRLFLRGRRSWRLEARLVGLIWIIEDALCFALNPAFG
jgi:hypothetical protein